MEAHLLLLVLPTPWKLLVNTEETEPLARLGVFVTEEAALLLCDASRVVIGKGGNARGVTKAIVVGTWTSFVKLAVNILNYIRFR